MSDETSAAPDPARVPAPKTLSRRVRQLLEACSLVQIAEGEDRPMPVGTVRLDRVEVALCQRQIVDQSFGFSAFDV